MNDINKIENKSSTSKYPGRIGLERFDIAPQANAQLGIEPTPKTPENVESPFKILWRESEPENAPTLGDDGMDIIRHALGRLEANTVNPVDDPNKSNLLTTDNREFLLGETARDFLGFLRTFDRLKSPISVFEAIMGTMMLQIDSKETHRVLDLYSEYNRKAHPEQVSQAESLLESILDVISK